MMAFYITGQLPKYKNDPVVVAAMKEASHKNLYAIAHSCGMNGVGPDTEIVAKTPGLLVLVRVLAVVFGAGFVASLLMWIKKNRKFKATEEYAKYKEFKEACEEK